MVELFFGSEGPNPVFPRQLLVVSGEPSEHRLDTPPGLAGPIQFALVGRFAAHLVAIAHLIVTLEHAHLALHLANLGLDTAELGVEKGEAGA